MPPYPVVGSGPLARVTPGFQPFVLFLFKAIDNHRAMVNYYHASPKANPEIPFLFSIDKQRHTGEIDYHPGEITMARPPLSTVSIFQCIYKARAGRNIIVGFC